MSLNPKEELLAALPPKRLNGSEALRLQGQDLSLTLLDFWQWSMSDLVSNLARGRLAEFIVAHALGIDVRRGVRNEWDAFDLTTNDGIKVEVKSSAFLQSWYQKRFSTAAWSVGPTRAWNPATNVYSSEARWQADVYVFALLDHRVKGTVEPLDLDQWSFFVIPRHRLSEQKRYLTRPAVEKLVGPAVKFDVLAARVLEVARPPSDVGGA